MNQTRESKMKSFVDIIAFHQHKAILNDLNDLFNPSKKTEGSPHSTESTVSVSPSFGSLLDLPVPIDMGNDRKVVQVQFRHILRHYKLPISLADLKIGEFVMVQSFVDKSHEDMGVVTEIMTENQFNDSLQFLGPSDDPEENKLGKLLRIALPEERKYLPMKFQREHPLLRICQTYTVRHSLPMIIHGVEYQFDGNVLFVYYTSRERVDFRPLVKFLIKMYCKGTRIQMKKTDQSRDFVPNASAAEALITATASVHGAMHSINRHYEVWCTGNCDSDVVSNATSPGVVLMGGGTDTDEGFLWQISHADKGDFVVLRASGDEAYNDWIYNLSIAAGTKLNSVRTILTKDKKASDETEVLTLLRSAEAIFMAGGDQSQYLDYWSGTEIQSIIQSKLLTVTVGGTSAGCAILGNWVYTGEKGSATSEEALANPYDRYITIVPAFLHIPFLETIVTDTHFVTRDRMGRMLTFLSRIMKGDYLEESSRASSVTRAVGIDEHTALLLDVTSGDVTAVGVGTAYLCSADRQATVCKEDTPLTFQDLSCVRLDPKSGDTFSFSSWSGAGVSYPSNVVNGVFTNLPYGPV